MGAVRSSGEKLEGQGSRALETGLRNKGIYVVGRASKVYEGDPRAGQSEVRKKPKYGL